MLRPAASANPLLLRHHQVLLPEVMWKPVRNSRTPPCARLQSLGRQNHPLLFVASVLTISSEPSPEIPPDTLLDIYFTRFHEKPFYIFDESSLRQRLQLNQVPNHLVHALYAVAAR